MGFVHLTQRFLSVTVDTVSNGNNKHSELCRYGKDTPFIGDTMMNFQKTIIQGVSTDVEHTPVRLKSKRYRRRNERLSQNTNMLPVFLSSSKRHILESVKNISAKKVVCLTMICHLAQASRTRTIFLTCVTLLIFLSSPVVAQQAMTGPVWGRHGAVQGVYRQMPGAGRVASFLGIPYAAPPVGEQRFQHAKPPSNWAGTHRADKHGPACPQVAITDSDESREIMQLQSEDCLYLNIFSPEKAIHDRQPFPEDRFARRNVRSTDEWLGKRHPDDPDTTRRNGRRHHEEENVSLNLPRRPRPSGEERNNLVMPARRARRDWETQDRGIRDSDRVIFLNRGFQDANKEGSAEVIPPKRTLGFFPLNSYEGTSGRMTSPVDSLNIIKSRGRNGVYINYFNMTNTDVPYSNSMSRLYGKDLYGHHRASKTDSHHRPSSQQYEHRSISSTTPGILANQSTRRQSQLPYTAQPLRQDRKPKNLSGEEAGPSLMNESRSKRTSKKLLSVLVIVPGQGYDWGSSQRYDASALAALGHLVVVTFNYRLGTLGFLNPGSANNTYRKGANYGMTDQLAALRWVQDNIMAFGGNPKKVTLMGHSASAACVHFLTAYTSSTDRSSFDSQLFHRAILMSGSAYSPWALVDNPQAYAQQAANQLDCGLADDIMDCMRNKSLEDILKVKYHTPQFLSAMGPSIDNVVIHKDWRTRLAKLGQSGSSQVELLVGLSQAEVYRSLLRETNVNDFHTDYRDRLLRTFIANNYNYHLQELFLAVSAEYTDWTKPGHQQPQSVRDLTVQALHDASVVAPVTATAVQASAESNRAVYFYVFNLSSNDITAQGSTADEVSLVLGLPLGRTGAGNSSLEEQQLSEAVILLWSNFVRNGNPNSWLRQDSGFRIDNLPYHIPEWPAFKPSQRYYLHFGLRGALPKDHYRAGKVALWTWLLPSLELIGARYGPDSSFHSLPDDSLTYSGIVRPKPSKWVIKTEYLAPLSTWPSLLFVAPTITAPHNVITPDSNMMQHAIRLGEHFNTTNEDFYSDSGGGSASVEIQDANISIVPVQRSGDLVEADIKQRGPPVHRPDVFPYATALGITVGLGCTLLLVNVSVWVFIRHKKKKKKRVVIVEEDTHIPSTPYITSMMETRSSPSHLQSSSVTIDTYCDNPHRLVSPVECGQCCHELSQSSPDNRGIALYQSNGGFGSLPRQLGPPIPATAPIHVESQPLLSPSTYVHDHLSGNTCTYDVHPPCITPCTSQTCTEIRL